MTLSLDRELDPLVSDRRRVAVAPRRSWASPEPVEVRPTAHNDADVRARRWAVVGPRLQRRALAADSMIALAVGTAFLVSVYSWQWQVVTTALLGAAGFVALIAVFNGYDLRRLGDGPEEFQSVLRAGTVGAGILMGASYITQVAVPRPLVLAGVPTFVVVAAVGRYVLRHLVHRERSEGGAMKRTLVVGEAADVSRITGELAGASYHGYRVEAVCLPSLDGPSEILGHPVVGAVADVAQVVADRAIDVVVVAGPTLSGEALRRLTWALDRVGAQLVVVPDLVEVTGPRITLRPAAGLSLLEVEVAAPRRRLIAKTLMDRFVGAGLLLMASPLILVSALAVRLTSPGPAFYSQTRVGVDGARFRMWKLRSMYVDADKRRVQLAEQSDGNGVLFKMRNDPRVTPVGRFLRRYSLDELPQLYNVFRGDMSLVGPRPPLGEEVAKYADPVRRRLRVRPGLTGLWQVSGRSDLSWEESVRLDLRYVDNWSVTMDLLILWKTARAVFAGSGAY